MKKLFENVYMDFILLRKNKIIPKIINVDMINTIKVSKVGNLSRG